MNTKFTHGVYVISRLCHALGVRLGEGNVVMDADMTCFSVPLYSQTEHNVKLYYVTFNWVKDRWKCTALEHLLTADKVNQLTS